MTAYSQFDTLRIRTLNAVAGNQPADFVHAIVDLDPPLLERVAVADRDGLVLQRLAVDGDAVRRAGLVLPAIAAADGPLLVVEDVEARLSGRDRSRWATSGMPSFFTSGNTAALIGAIRGWNFITTRSCILPFSSGSLVFGVGLAEEGQRGPIGAGRRLDHVRHVNRSLVRSSR